MKEPARNQQVDYQCKAKISPGTSEKCGLPWRVPSSLILNVVLLPIGLAQNSAACERGWISARNLKCRIVLKKIFFKCCQVASGLVVCIFFFFFQLQDTAFAARKFEKVFANPGACSCTCRTGSKCGSVNKTMSHQLIFLRLSLLSVLIFVCAVVTTTSVCITLNYRYCASESI